MRALSSNSSSEQLQTLKFESDPLGAEVHTAQGQTCKTPCELKVPSHEQSVIIIKDDYLPQTFHVTLGPQPDHSFWENPPPTSSPIRSAPCCIRCPIFVACTIRQPCHSFCDGRHGKVFFL